MRCREHLVCRLIDELALFILFLLTAGVLACNPLKGTQGMDVQRAQFTNGTTRHPAAYDSALVSLEQCAQKYVDALPSPADSLGGSPFLPERIDAPFDSIAAGGVWVLDNLTNDTASHVGRSWDRADGVYQDSVRRVFLTVHAYRLRDEVEHELAHGLADYYPALRDPPGVVSSARRNDHTGPFFRACVTYNPGV